VVAAVPVARGTGAVEAVSVRLAASALVALVAGIVLGWARLVPVSIALAAGSYAAQLAVDDVALDPTAPLLAVAVLLAAELAYWSLEERERPRAEPGAGRRHAVFVAALGVAALAVGVALLALADVARTEGLALDVLGASAAAAVLAAIALASRAHGRRRR